MKMAVVHINTCKEHSVAPTAMIAQYVADTLGIPFIHDKISASKYMDSYDVLFVKYGILLYCDFREQLFQIYENAGRVINLENDYTMEPDYRLTKRNSSYEVWSNMPWSVKKHGGAYINWNMLTWERVEWTDPKLKGLGYYGSYRPDREVYFEKYFKSSLYPVHISTYKRNAISFRDLNPNIKIYSPFRHRQQIQAFQMVLYIEDRFIHTHYNSPANRFYECLYNGVPMCFDKSCRNTFREAGYVIDPFVVDGPKDVQKLLKNSHQVMALQHEQWYRDYRKELDRQFRKAVYLRIDKGGKNAD